MSHVACTSTPRGHAAPCASARRAADALDGAPEHERRANVTLGPSAAVLPLPSTLHRRQKQSHNTPLREPCRHPALLRRCRRFPPILCQREASFPVNRRRPSFLTLRWARHRAPPRPITRKTIRSLPCGQRRPHLPSLIAASASGSAAARCCASEQRGSRGRESGWDGIGLLLSGAASTSEDHHRRYHHHWCRRRRRRHCTSAGRWC